MLLLRLLLLLHVLILALPASASVGTAGLYIPDSNRYKVPVSSYIMPSAVSVISFADYGAEAKKIIDYARGQSNILKGQYGEMVMNKVLTANEPGWTFVSPTFGKGGRQGLDGLYIRYRKDGRPYSVMVTEAKYGSSQLGKTKDGKQMSENYVRKRLGKIADKMSEAAGAVDTGNFQERRTPPPKSNGTQATIRLKNGKEVTVFKNRKGEWCVYPEGQGTKEEISQALKSHEKLIRAASNGGITYRSRLYRVKATKNGPEVTVYDLDKNAKIIKGSGRKINTADMPKTVEDIRKGLVNSYVERGMSRKEAKKKVEGKSDQEVLDEAGKDALVLNKNFYLGALKASVLAAGTTLALSVIEQAIQKGEIDWEQDITRAFVIFVSTGPSYLAGAYTTLQYGNAAGFMAGGAVMSLLSSYGMYKMGLIDLNTAGKQVAVSIGMTGAIGGGYYAAKWAYKSIPIIAKTVDWVLGTKIATTIAAIPGLQYVGYAAFVAQGAYGVYKYNKAREFQRKYIRSRLGLQYD